MSHQMNEALVYGFDPLCGWCFAFRPTMAALTAANPDLPVELKMGGLVVGERVAPIAATRDYLIRGLAQVQQTAGVSAGRAFYDGLLAEGTYISNSEPPCRAIVVMQQLAPGGAYGFADAIPEAFYARGLRPDNSGTLAELAQAHGADPEAFLSEWGTERAREATQAAFAQARGEGFVSYPTLCYRRGESLTVVARGFLTPGQAVARVRELRSS